MTPQTFTNNISRRITDFNLPIKLILSRLIGIILFLTTGLLTGSTTWIIKSGYIETTTFKVITEAKIFSQKAGFYLDEILVQGRKRTDPSYLLDAVGVERGLPIMAININALKQRIENLPWVNNAIVERKLPNIIHIVLEEREPIALWQNKGKFMPIDNNGVAINVPIDNLINLPIVIGEKAPAQAANLLAMLKNEPELTSRMKAAILVGERRWNIILDDLNKGISIRLPEQETDKAWTKLAQIDRQYQLLKRKLTMIDLRLPNRLVVKIENEYDKTKNKTKKGRNT